MKTKLRLLSIFLFIFIASISMAQSVDINTAKTIAEHHLSTIIKQSLKSADNKGTSLQFTSIKVEVENKDTLYYILNDTINNSFVIVSADKRVTPILGFSTEGSFDENKQPEAFTAWMNVKKKEIEFIIKNNVQPDQTIIKSWENLSLKNGFIESSPVGPLLKTKWGQGFYYNEGFPIYPPGSDEHAGGSCVQTAIAQIMKYWSYPTRGKGSNSFVDPNFNLGFFSADFGATTYQWNQMPDIVTESNNALATLMYHCFVATYWTNYQDVANPIAWSLINYFDYSTSAKYLTASYFTDNQWSSLFKQELELGRPVFLGIKGSSTNEGHAVVCDGYIDNDYFHFNWGWDGACDGYYSLNATSYTNGNSQFDGKWYAIVGIVPSQLPDGYMGFFLSTKSINLSTNLTKSISINASGNWIAKADQTWINLSTLNGKMGTSTLYITASENDTNEGRHATVTITCEGFPPQIIKVIQNRSYTVTPGGLKSALGNDLSSITNLFVNGTIDARDFKTMRDLMPQLEEIDISKVSIAAYTGAEGTYASENSIYEANAIPLFAFEKYPIPSTLRSIKLPSTTSIIGTSAFSNCVYLDSIIIPPHVEDIHSNAFSGCNSIRNINIPSSVTSIGTNVFICAQLNSVTVDPNNSNYSGFDGVLFNKSQTELIFCLNTKSGSYSIPKTVRFIDDIAFNGCFVITSLSIPNSVTSIGWGAFMDCRGLTLLNLPTSITSIGRHAFHNCINLNSITANWLTPIDLKNAEEVFYNVDKSTCKLYVPYGTASLYAAANQWKDFQNIVEMPNQSPIANTDTDLSINEGTTVTLDGSASVDSDGQAITYLWTAPVGIALSSSTAVKPTFIAPEVKKDSTIIFSLIVNDGILNSVPSTVKVNVVNVIKVGISELSAQTLKVYPNPVTNELILENEGNTNKTEFEIINSVGQTVTLGITQDKTIVQTDHFTPGIYLIKLKSGETIEFRKIIKK